jgi:hypothetical protein
VNQQTVSQAGSAVWLDRMGTLLRRLAPAIAAFAIAFAIDIATGQRYSSIWGGIAIVISVVTVFPAVRPALAALGAFAGVWAAFNLVRAVADDAGVALVGADTVAGWERALFGVLPSAWLQDSLFAPDTVRVVDIALSVVHGSFFVAPFVVAALLWWKRRPLFRRYTVATAATFALGLVGFLLLPAAPPWLAEPDSVSRVTHHLLGGSGASLARADGEPGFWFEPNPLAALPSIHVAATVLILLAVRRIGRLVGVLAGAYAQLMTFAVVYLGEHYVLDAVLGWVVAVVGWWIAGRLTAGGAIAPNQNYGVLSSSSSSSNQARPG